MTAFLAHELDSSLNTANLTELFGSPVTLLGRRRPSIHKPMELIAAYRDALKEHGYDPSKDVIVLTGRSVYLTLLMRALREYPAVQAAMYDAPTGRYYEVTL